MMRTSFIAWPARLSCIGAAAVAMVIGATAPSAASAQGATPQVQAPGSQLGIVNRRGVATVISNLPDSLSYMDPVISPDGKTIAVSASVPRNTSSTSIAGAIAASLAAGPPSGTQIYLYTLPDGPLRKVSSGSRDLLPQWVPGRNEISYIRRTAIGDTSAALIIRGTGADDAERVAFSLPFLTAVTWFPDGERVIAAVGGPTGMPEGKFHIVPLNDPSASTPIVNDKLVKTRPQLTRDGSMLAYEGAEVNISPSGLLRPGSKRIFVYRFADSSIASIAGGSGTTPEWSHTGDVLFFRGQSGAMYSSRVRGGRALSIDTPTLLSEIRYDAIATAFSVLPGDSLWLIRMPRERAVLAEVPANIRGRRATTAEQRGIEFAAARAIVPIATQAGLGFERHGLDSRAYALPGDPPFAGYSDTLKAYTLASHIDGHNRAIGEILKVAGVLPATGGCNANRPQGCRSGPYPGLVAFSPAIVSVDSARISVYRTLDGIGLVGGTEAAAAIATWHITLVGRGTTWTVRSVK